VFVGVLASSLGILIALSRAGSSIFWRRGADPQAAAGHEPFGGSRSAAMVFGLGLVVAASVLAKPIGDYTGAAAAQLTDRRAYIDAVLNERPVAPLYDIRREMRERGEGK
jgi:multicomponent K+:H+ antiporter subunit D